MMKIVVVLIVDDITSEDLRNGSVKVEGGTTKGGWDRYGSDGQKLENVETEKKVVKVFSVFESNLAQKVGLHFVRRKDQPKERWRYQKRSSKNQR